MPSFNYTDRRRITRRQTRIALTSARLVADGVRTFNADLDLSDKLPGDARVFIEAYRANPPVRMRFDWGTVASPDPPADRRLADFAGDPRPPLFRVKVTDAQQQPGRLLADASQIRPADPDEPPQTKRGILYTEWGDNHGPVWKVGFDFHLGPKLTIDRTADADGQLPLRREFRALVYPEIIRIVLTRLLFSEDDGAAGELADDTLDWPKQWLHFPRRAFGFTQDPPAIGAERDAKLDWITDAVDHCARAAGFCAMLAPKGENQP